MLHRKAGGNGVAFVIGVVLALAVGVFSTAVGLDRDRALYPAVTIVVGSYYVLFAVMGASTRILVLESIVGLIFLAAAALGFRSSLWIVAAALAGHGLFDLVHGRIISNPGVPAWWPAWCLAFDATAGAYLAWRIKSKRIRVTAT
jgi:hypothetical protein